jgi:hypothetical protein
MTNRLWHNKLYWYCLCAYVYEICSRFVYLDFCVFSFFFRDESPLRFYFAMSKMFWEIRKKHRTTLSKMFWEIRKKHRTTLSLTFGYRTCPHDRHTCPVYDVLSIYFELKSELDYTYLVPNAHHPHTAQRVLTATLFLLPFWWPVEGHTFYHYDFGLWCIFLISFLDSALAHTQHEKYMGVERV